MKYSIEIDEKWLNGHTPKEFREPRLTDDAVMEQGGRIVPGTDFTYRCGPRLILAQPEPEPKFEPGTYVRCVGTDCIYRVTGADGSHIKVEFPGMGGFMQPTYGRPEVFSHWVPAPGERVWCLDTKEFAIVAGVGFDHAGQLIVNSTGEPGVGRLCDAADLIPAAFAPMPAEPPPAIPAACYPDQTIGSSVISEVANQAGYEDTWAGRPEQRAGFTRKPPPTCDIDLEVLVNIFASAGSALGSIAEQMDTLAEQLQNMAEAMTEDGKAAKA